MKLTDTQIKRILIAGGIVFLILRFRGELNPNKETLSANGEESNAINRAISRLKSGSVDVASTPEEVLNAS